MSKRPYTGDTDKIIESLRTESGGADNIKHVNEQPHYDPERWLGAITVSVLQAGHQARWNYTVKKVTLDASGTGFTVVTGTGALTVTAINLLELAHIAEPALGTVWYVWGTQSHKYVTGSNYPAGFAPLPVGGGGTTGTHKVDTPVEITVRADADGSPIYTFSEVGSHDGTCT